MSTNKKTNLNILAENRNRKTKMNAVREHNATTFVSPQVKTEVLQVTSFLEDFAAEVDETLELYSANAYFNMAAYLVRGHLEAKTITPTALISASRVPYATATRRLKEMVDSGLIDQRPRTKTGKSFTMHPSDKLLNQWMRLTGRVRRLADTQFGSQNVQNGSKDYFFGGSYMSAKSIPPMQVLSEPLKVAGGIRALVHGDPTFMVMENLKRQFEQVIGTQIHQRAFSIDRLREEALRNAERKTSRYDIIALDLPWVGEFAENGILMPLAEIMDLSRLDPSDFHTAGWKAAHWGGRAYGVPAQTTPELLFYRKDLFAQAGIEAPATTDQLLHAAEHFHDPHHGRYGIAWNAARGTALGHTVLMTMADFGQPIVGMDEIAGGYDTDALARRDYKFTIDTPKGLAAAEFLLQLLRYSPPDILSMSWYERVRPYASGNIAMAYGYTLLAPYFELDETSPAFGQTGYAPHPSAPGVSPVAPVGGYVMGIPANLPAERVPAAVEALIAFTSPEAQKLYVQNGSRTNPRYSVGADPEVRRLSPIFEAVDGMSWRDELQHWPRPPVPEICDVIQICGEEFHDMLRGIHSPRDALRKAQERADRLLENNAIT